MPLKKYTRVANEILDNIAKVNLNGTQFRIVMIVWRYTYGFQRKEHELSLTFLAKALATSRSQVDRELSTLIKLNIINVVGIGERRSRIITFNKNFSEWEVSFTEERCTPGIIPKSIRDVVLERDDYKCRYCGSKHDLTMDHVYPKSLGGENTVNNLVTACRSCNSRKGSKTLEEAGLKLRRLGAGGGK